jgi:hypothetical protein
VNSNQKLTLLWTAAILVAMLLLPPFDNGEYGCIAAPPTNHYNRAYDLSYMRLFTQFGVVIVAAAAIYFARGGGKDG